MAVSENETFTFMWQIQNFSMCPQTYDEGIMSPTFVVDFLKKTEWRIIMYPRGNYTVCESECNCISCYLERTTNDSYDETLTIGFSFVVSSIDDNKAIKKEIPSHSFKKGYKFGSFIKREDFFNSTDEILPNDTLTINLSLWSADNKSKIANTAVFNTVYNCCDTKANLETNLSSAITVIKMRSKSILWPIKGFSALQPNAKLTRTFDSFIQDQASLDITLCLKGSTMADKCYVSIEMSVESLNDLGNHIYIRNKIKTLGNLKSIQFQAQGGYFLTYDRRWRFSPFIKMKDLKDSKYLYYTDDTLLLHFEFHYSIPNFRVKNEDFPIFECRSEYPNCHDCENNEFLNLYRSGKLSDVTLRAGTKAFKVHKNILSLKSDVFSAMFESDMQEKVSGVVEIADFDPDTVDRLLTFMYTNALENLTQEDAVKLYSVSDKYNVVCLKSRCRCVLMSTLSMSNVSQILTLADLHQDEDLLEAVRCFIQMNSDLVFTSQNWRDFTKNNLRLAADIMLYILSKNFSS